MVPLQHQDPEPASLTAFNAANPDATVADFESPAFRAIKAGIKAALHQDQGGLCVYCECALEPTEGHIDHIKPKGGDNAHPQLCFSYTNYAHSCNTRKTCGDQKKAGLLPIEPSPDCNARWTLSTSDGQIVAHPHLTRAERGPVTKTLDMLGLNRSHLTADRKDWIDRAVTLLVTDATAMPLFLRIAPYRHLLTDLFPA